MFNTTRVLKHELNICKNATTKLKPGIQPALITSPLNWRHIAALCFVILVAKVVHIVYLHILDQIWALTFTNVSKKFPFCEKIF